MTQYKEEDFLSLSGIQHFEFCRRQWALIHIEMQWDENFRTIEGHLLHKKAHDEYSTEKRGDIIISRGMPIFSRTLGVNGVCDIVEFHRHDDGTEIFGRDGKFKVFPVEYKRGEPKDSDIDILQLAAQAMCLEEMLCCNIEEGSIFYGETRRRTLVKINEHLRNKVKARFKEMHEMYDKRHTPKVKPTKSCNACSLKNLCLPKLCKNKSAKEYIFKNIREGDLT
ncbi:MAG: CRISPR-associated protein Cas4 [Clostridiales bacterium]|nr:CRISPR-associated protein Cas4 [Clostridiales bacterium]